MVLDIAIHSNHLINGTRSDPNEATAIEFHVKNGTFQLLPTIEGYGAAFLRPMWTITHQLFSHWVLSFALVAPSKPVSLFPPLHILVFSSTVSSTRVFPHTSLRLHSSSHIQHTLTHTHKLTFLLYTLFLCPTQLQSTLSHTFPPSLQQKNTGNGSKLSNQRFPRGARHHHPPAGSLRPHQHPHGHTHA